MSINYITNAVSMQVYGIWDLAKTCKVELLKVAHPWKKVVRACTLLLSNTVCVQWASLNSASGNLAQLTGRAQLRRPFNMGPT